MSDTTTTPGIEITRRFDAPRELVFRAWTTPASFAHWFGGTEAEVPVESVVMDVRVGGRWSAVMYAGPDRQEIPWKGVYREVVEPERLVFTLTDQPDDSDEAITVELADVDGGTVMTFIQSGGNLPIEQYAAAKAGWEHFFEVMAGMLA
ncbi:SRPBCC domain-containing protein [Pseudonocardia sp.]|jgi:uncharacterized protein YndB with AHSA1/START domain|uniref:SRPBCC family protein n=1 Tax=Pseudonocardia sp. TaxID=60912 RepID=UPI0026161FD8|nr:SRPBCC domain-containing protein [Pseudonocardia sp.]MCW2720188.1 hypothetical protein [Pseudonocardia sp.]MDT7612736.1 hypothetical protein [Pseudonocardiales bacterium]